MFFRSSDGLDVVLIHVTGGSSRGKVSSLKKAILKLQADQDAKNTGVTVHGVILAPADKGPSKHFAVKSSECIVDTVNGEEARDLLGGLEQLFQYMM